MMPFPGQSTRKQQGLTLIELLLALALTALLGLMLATLIDGWVGLRTHKAEPLNRDAEVLSLCQQLEHRFAALIERPLQTQGLVQYNARLDWQADRGRLEWVALSGPGLAGLNTSANIASSSPGRFGEQQNWQVAEYQYSAVQRQALQWLDGELWFGVSADLDTPATPRWQTLSRLTSVQAVQLLFRVDEQWQPYPAPVGRRTEAVRLSLSLALDDGDDPLPYVCTFMLPGEQ